MHQGFVSRGEADRLPTDRSTQSPTLTAVSVETEKGQRPRFRPPDRVDRLSEVLPDVELVMHDLRTWDMLRRTGHEPLPHVD